MTNKNDAQETEDKCEQSGVSRVTARDTQSWPPEWLLRRRASSATVATSRSNVTINPKSVSVESTTASVAAPLPSGIDTIAPMDTGAPQPNSRDMRGWPPSWLRDLRDGNRIGAIEPTNLSDPSDRAESLIEVQSFEAAPAICNIESTPAIVETPSIETTPAHPPADTLAIEQVEGLNPLQLRWAGARLGSIVAFDTETELIDGVRIPQLALATACDGSSTVLIHPDDSAPSSSLTPNASSSFTTSRSIFGSSINICAPAVKRTQVARGGASFKMVVFTTPCS